MAEASAGWAALDAELCAWAAAGRTASLWWRDDDAATANDALQCLLELAENYSVPVALSIIPRQAGESLRRRIELARTATPIVHGYAHLNHAPIAEKQSEFGAHRDIAVMRKELGEGLSLLRNMFGGRLFPVLTPPWNRLTEALYPYLPQLGYCGVSAFRPALKRVPFPGLVQTNCHIDGIDWHSRRGQRPAADVLNELTTLLRVRRLHPHIAADTLVLGKPLAREFDPGEPTGILTHHLAHEPETWEFLTRLLKTIAPHCRPGGGARWLTCREAFSEAAAAPV